METIIENNGKPVQMKKTFIIGWVMMDSKKYINEPLWPFIIRAKDNRKKRNCIKENKKNLSDHGLLNPMIPRKGNYTPGNVYNKTKEIFLKIGKLRVCWY